MKTFEKFNNIMKTTITTFLLLICMTGMGQDIVKDSLCSWVDNLFIEPPQYDTIPVLMLVGDTVTCYRDKWVYDTIQDNLGKGYIMVNIKKMPYIKSDIWQQKGFEVRVVDGYFYREYYEKVPNYVHHVYLDENKQPLPITYVVWEVK